MSTEDQLGKIFDYQMKKEGDLDELRRAICQIAERLDIELDICNKSRGGDQPPPWPPS